MRLRTRKRSQSDVDPDSNEAATQNIHDSSSDDESDDDMKELAAKTCETMKETLGLTSKSSTLIRHNSKGKNNEDDLFTIDKSPSGGSSKDMVVANESEDDAEQIKATDVSVRKSKKKRRRKKKSIQDASTVKDPWAHSSGLHVAAELHDVYVNVNTYKNPTGVKEINSKVVLGKDQGKKVMQQSVVTPNFEKQHQVDPYHTSLNQLKKRRKTERDGTKGRGWFDMKAPEVTEDAKNDLMVLQMRRALDPKRFYKGPDIRALPKFYQMARVVDSPVDFYSDRIPKKQRKRTLVDELLADAEFRKYNKRKYSEIVEAKNQGRGAYRHMKRLKKKKK